MTPSEKIDFIKKESGVSSHRALSARVGLSTPQTIADIRAGKYGITPDVAKKFNAAFPHIRWEWLAYDEEPIYTSEIAESIPYYDSTERMISGKACGKVNVGTCFRNAAAALRTGSDAMTEFPVGSILVLRPTNPELMIPGGAYVFVTGSMCLVRRMQLGSTDDRVALYASCERVYGDGRKVYETFEIERASIVSVYQVDGYIYALY